MGKAPRTEADIEFDRQVGERIRNLRMASRRTQMDIARDAGVTFQQLQKYETGANRLATSKLAAISRALDVSMARLLGEGDEVPAASARGRADVQRLVQAYSTCRPSAQAVVLKLAQTFGDRSGS